MANKKLSQKEIAKRLVRLRNLEKLHRVSKQMRSKKDELIQLQAEQIEKLQDLATRQQELLDAQAIRIAELETIVFGKKKRPPTIPPSSESIPATPPKPPRSKDSFKRAVPSDEVVTDSVLLSVDHCQCGGKLTDITTHVRYIEDIPLPELTTDYTAKLVTKYLVQRGVCTKCGKPTSGQPLGGAIVSVGPNARLLVTHLIAGLGMSYSQTASLLLSLYDFSVSDGEVANIVATQHAKWQPAYQQLLSDIRGSPVVHGDETPWPIQDLQGHGYAWVLSDAGSSKVCFALEQSRGAVHAGHLFGDGTDQPFAGVRISDDYAAYRSESLPGQQQLCWAHLYRAIRDLRYNANLPEEQVAYVTWWYEQFTAIYEDLRMYLAMPFDAIVRNTQANELWARVRALVSTTNTTEPLKLTKLKAQLNRAGQDKLFICLSKDTPCDNNRAERDLRQLVLKRKRSFGSKSEKGASALATVLSICTTNWRIHPNNYFSALAGVGRV
jgi:transposase